ncbi:MAG: hypothetical protein IJS27_07135, partial [Ruminococcus sp.]|nr:hypothetical protein [Ruminococcus sp.]
SCLSVLIDIRACLKNDKTHKEADLFPQSCVIFLGIRRVCLQKKPCLAKKSLAFVHSAIY